jgi:hypothetical protein
MNTSFAPISLFERLEELAPARDHRERTPSAGRAPAFAIARPMPALAPVTRAGLAQKCRDP